MADVYRPEFNNSQATFPGPHVVKLDAAVNGELGKMIVTVSGYGRVPAAANAATGKMRGVITHSNDNTAGAQGALSVTARPGVYAFDNDGVNPCTQADVGNTVYATSGTAIGRDSGGGPPAGTLIEFNSSDPQGRPCRVALKCFV